MADYSGIERLLGLPEGSTQGSDPMRIAPVLSTGIKNKTNELAKKSTNLETLEDMPSSELIKAGLSLELLERDKVTIRTEAFEVYRIAKSILERFKQDIDDLVDVNDRMYASGGKLIESVTGSLDKLSNLVMKYKQDEEIKGITLVNANDDGSKDMSPQDWIAFVNQIQDNPLEEAKDAEIITPEQ